MDGPVTTLGDENAVGDRAQALIRTTRPIPPMRPLFGANALDRGLLQEIVAVYARIKKLDYEAAHQRLSRIATKSPFGEVSPDYLLRPGEIENRNSLRVQMGKRRLMKEKFSAQKEKTRPDALSTLFDDLDGKGETPEKEEELPF